MKHADQLLEHYLKVAEFIAAVFGSHIEAVVHDYRKPGSSIVAIFNGHVTDRKVGGRTSDVGYKRLTGTFPDIAINYPNQGSKGELLKSSGLAIRNEEGDLIGALAINIDVSLYEKIQSHLQILLHTNVIEGSPEKEDFHFLESSKEMRRMIQDTLIRLNLHAKKLSKKDKSAIIQILSAEGIFKVRGSVQLVSESLQMSRPGVYQYLRELGA